MEAKNYRVKELTKMSGVSARTLHYYDQIGLLKPLNRTQGGYRCYGRQELLRLQQILFFKELDFPLKEIIELLDHPNFDLMKALHNHRTALKLRKKRIVKLLATIDKTIHQLNNQKMMSKPEMLYEGLSKEFGTSYRKEAMDKFGTDKVVGSEKELLSLGKEGFGMLKKELEQINAELFDHRHEKPESEPIQKLISQHYVIIRKFWGTSKLEDKQAEAYAGLGQLYVNDERYTMVDGIPQAEYAVFLQKAI